VVSIEVRPYLESDETAVVGLWREVFSDVPGRNDPQKDIQRKLGVQRELFLVATSGRELVGTAMAGYDGQRGWVHYLAVHPDHRRQGIGTALMRSVEERLIGMGCPKLNLQVRASNQSVLPFYRRLGYLVEERISVGKPLRSSDSSASEQT
jgi:ribosomal protein S18 acetylase RimI-like enzyme